MAENENIPVSVSMSIPSTYHKNELELSITLSNLLENAIHACEKLPENERYIKPMKKMTNMSSLVNIVAAFSVFIIRFIKQTRNRPNNPKAIANFLLAYNNNKLNTQHEKVLPYLEFRP